MGAQEDYEAALQDALRPASPKAIRICVAWYGNNFGRPGWGSVEFVRTSLVQAQKAIKALEEE